MVLLILLGSTDILSQSNEDVYGKYNIYRNPARLVINKFSISLTSGFGKTKFSHDLKGLYFYQDGESQIVWNNTVQPSIWLRGNINWMNNPTAADSVLYDNIFELPYKGIDNPVFSDTIRNQPFLVNGDTTLLVFERYMNSIPVQLSIHYNYKEFRVGGGINWERQYIKPLEPSQFGNQVRNYVPNFKKTQYFRYFGLLGYKFYDFWDFSFVAEMEVGNIKSGRQFNPNFITRGIYSTFGISIEQNRSQYFRLILKPSIELKSYNLTLGDGAVINHKQNAFFLRIGASVNIPEIPRSPIRSDKANLKHVITDPRTGQLMEVRGQPFWKKQNPKVGQNHRQLFKYKLKNRKKLHPY